MTKASISDSPMGDTPMQVSSAIVDTPPLPAATVALLRDSSDGLEVFLMKRHSQSDVMGGLYVFPGGKVDARDAAPAWIDRLDQPAEGLRRTLGEPGMDTTTATSLYVAAVREVFEESGVLLAHGADATPATGLLRAGQPFDAALAQLGLTLHTRNLLPWSRWITPRMPSLNMAKRFDTRFFVAAVPSEQVAVHDNYETTDSVWLRPRVALQQYWDRQIQLPPPQIMSLAHLARHHSVQGLLDEVRERLPPVIRPEPFDEEGCRVICYPGDVRHPESARVMPGPTRLLFRNQRFEPDGGFDALFA